MIMIEPDWNPKNEEQVMGRIWRIGQTRKVFIYRLFMCGTIEEKMLQRQINKEAISENVIDSRKTIAKWTPEQLKKLFNFVSDTKCLTFGEELNEKLFVDNFVIIL